MRLSRESEAGSDETSLLGDRVRDNPNKIHYNIE